MTTSSFLHALARTVIITFSFCVSSVFFSTAQAARGSPTAVQINGRGTAANLNLNFSLAEQRQRHPWLQFPPAHRRPARFLHRSFTIPLPRTPDASKGTGKTDSTDHFVRRRGRQLFKAGKPFYVNGFNTYWLMYIASISDQRYLVNKVLNQARSLGLTVCRTGAFFDGPGWHALQPQPGVFDEATFQALDYAIATAARFSVRLHLVLTGNWNDYGGKPQYIAWSKQNGGNPPNDDTAFFVDPLCRQYYKNFVKAVILRRNTITGVVYRDDPTIFGWELINEPRVYDDPSGNVLQAWIVEMAAHIKSLDSNHLLSIGAEGFYGPSTPSRQHLNAEFWMANVGTDFVRNNQAPGVDIASVHAYVNSRYDASTWTDRMAYYTKWLQGHIDDGNGVLNMPIMFGEFGPDSFRSSDGTMEKRNQVYQTTYSIMQASAKAGGAGSAALFWQLLVDELRSWDDGIGIYFSQTSTTSIIARQSHAI